MSDTKNVSNPILLKDLPGPKGIPFFGNAFDVKLENLHNDFAKWANEYGDIYKVRLGPKTHVVVSNPEMIQEMLRLRPKEFVRMKKLDKVIRAEGIHGVFNAEGDDWRTHRLIVAKGLDVKHQEQFFPYMLVCIERLYNKWKIAAESGGEINIQQDFLRFTVDVTTFLAFAYEMNTIEEQGGVIQDYLEKIFPTIFKRINEPIPYHKIWKTKKDREFDKAIIEIKNLISDFIENGKRRIEENPELRENPSTVLEAIIVAAETEEGFGDEEVRGNLMTLLMAGEDTTAHTLAWSIFLLTKSENAELIPQLRKEVDELLGNDAWLKEYGLHKKFHYLEGIANETMRIQPVAPIILNEPTEDIDVLGYHFDKGTSVVILPRVAANSDTYFTDAYKMMPERWIQATKCPVHDVHAFVPFGAGPRYCPGRNLAYLEIKLVLSMLFKNFEIEMLTKHEEVNEIMAFTMMASDFRVRLKLRSE